MVSWSFKYYVEIFPENCRKADCNPVLQEEIANQKEGEKPKEGLPFFHWICQPYIRPGWVTYIKCSQLLFLPLLSLQSNSVLVLEPTCIWKQMKTPGYFSCGFLFPVFLVIVLFMGMLLSVGIVSFRFSLQKVKNKNSTFWTWCTFTSKSNIISM